MFRTFCASLSVSGISFAKSLFILSASEETGRRDGPEIWVDPIDKLSMATVLDETGVCLYTYLYYMDVYVCI